MKLPIPRHRARVPVVALGMLALVGAIAGGLVRMDWPLRVPSGLVAFHGPLMVGGFLGTVIGLERAVALGRPWTYAGPVATGLGALALTAGVPGGAALMTLGSGVMLLAFVVILQRQPALFNVVMALGALSWLVGQVIWLAGWPTYRAVFWWAGFLVLTIAGERLELTRVFGIAAKSRIAFVAIVATLLIALPLIAIAPDAGVRLTGIAWVALAAWLGVFDIARHTVRKSGLTRFIAITLLGGYVWLGAAGIMALSSGHVAAGLEYDAILHALFLGLVFSMIFGHAPIIFPAILGVRMAYRPAFYAHVILLHASVALRVVGDLVPWIPGRQWGGLLNGLGVLVFLVNTVYGVLGMPAGSDDARPGAGTELT